MSEKTPAGDGSNSALPNAARRKEALGELNKALKSRDRKEKAAPLGVVFATLAIIVALVGGIWYLASYDPTANETTASESDADDSRDTSQYGKLPERPLTPYGRTVTCKYEDDPTNSKHSVGRPSTKNVAATGDVKATLTINGSKVPVNLDRTKSPCTTNSFEFLVKKGFYNDTKCHRTVKSSGMQIIQCGDPTAKGAGSAGYKYADEYPTNGVTPDQAAAPLTYPRGTLAMANSGPNTNGSQFFLVTQDTILPPAYNVFGSISNEGLKALDAILEKQPEGDTSGVTSITINSAVVTA